MIVITNEEALLRILAALIAGSLIGFSRRSYPAGIRTFTLICLGSAIFTIISIDPVFQTPGSNVDPTRTISQIVTGIGFLGAGVIWKLGGKVGGLTTAAAIWTVASLGILFGMGEYVLGAATTFLVLLVLVSKGPLEKLGIDKERKT